MIFFSIAMGAAFSFQLISIEIYAPNILDTYDKLFLGSVYPSDSAGSDRECVVFIVADRLESVTLLCPK